MNFRVVNIVDDLSRENMGIWNSAVSTADKLRDYGVETQLWGRGVCDVSLGVPFIQVGSVSRRRLLELVKAQSLTPERDIIVTHGCWQFPTKWGRCLQSMGYKWIYTPHGMLEPWALSQKKLKKILYFYLIEKPAARKAHIVRAVSTSESLNLKRFFGPSEVKVIPNGVELSSSAITKNPQIKRYLFLSRLHKKKGVAELTVGWTQSLLNNRHDCELLLVGPDQGELAAVEKDIANSTNIRYLGPLYGAEKREVMRSCHFFVLPSFSEGFPTVVLEAMSEGLLCLISPGCNLPEAFDDGVATSMQPNVTSIIKALEATQTLTSEQIENASDKSRAFVSTFFSISAVAAAQYSLYKELRSGE